MHIKINESLLLKRFNALIKLFKIRPDLLARRIFWKGLKSMEKAAGIGPVANLAAGVKKDIAANPSLSHKELASRHCVPPVTVKEYRHSLAIAYLQTGGWQKETDGAIGQRFGLQASYILGLRRNQRLLRIRSGGCPKGGLRVAEYIEKLGGAETIKKALTEGGQTIVGLFREAGIDKIGKERQRQIMGAIGLTGNSKQRTERWYANRRKVLKLAA